MCTNIKEYKRYKELFEEYWLKKREHFVRSPFEFVTTQEFLLPVQNPLIHWLRNEHQRACLAAYMQQLYTMISSWYRCQEECYIVPPSTKGTSCFLKKHENLVCHSITVSQTPLYPITD